MSDVRPLSVPGAWLFLPDVYTDERGAFAETYTASTFLETVGHALVVAQVNTSVSRRGTLRGVHYSVAPGGQAKYVTCAAGTVLDVVVDLRVGSDTFGTHDSVELDASSRQAVFLSEGLGHAFLALTDDAVVTYLCSTSYAPQHELTVSAVDPALGLPWPAALAPYVLSQRDASAPTLAEATAAGRLPHLVQLAP